MVLVFLAVAFAVLDIILDELVVVEVAVFLCVIGAGVILVD